MVTQSQGGGVAAQVTGGKRVLVGTNVVLATLLVVGIVVVLQLIAYKAPRRWDMTSSGVNSLGEATENLLRGLDQNIRLTSLYFETDREEADQPRYRQAARNLLGLYEGTNRGRIVSEWINPLKDHEKLQGLLTRLRQKAAFKEGIEAYKASVDRYQNDLDGRMRDLLQKELDRVGPAVGAMSGSSAGMTPVAQIEELLRRLSAELQGAREQIDAFTGGANPQLAAAVNELRSLYPKISKALKEISKFAAAELQRNSNVPPAQAEYLRDAGNRYAELVAALEGETTTLQELEPLKLDELLGQLQPTANAIVLETDDDAVAVDFGSVWPPLDQNAAAGRVPFEKRAFKGEEKLTAAILRATHKEQTAVVFVRYGGQPLFMGGFMPNQPRSAYASMRQQLEDANFIVDEWDLKTKDTPPEIKPAPTRTIFVVLKPEPPQRGPMGQPSQDPPFTDKHRSALLKAMGDKGRALFIAGWAPGPFPGMPSTYEYNDYLKKDWGVSLDTSALLIGTINIAPGKYQVVRRDFFNMDDLELANHDIVRGPQARQLTLPACAPLDLSAPPPEGVKVDRLVAQPKRDGIWGVKSLQKYQEQLNQREYMTREDGDLEGPFDLAVAAQKGDTKIVVVSSREFAEDEVAFAMVFAPTAQGFTIRSRNPGNVSLLVNSLHWLNDNTQFMNIGKPIDAAVLAIPRPSTVAAVQGLTIFAWPALALGCGGVAWWIRRR